MKYWDIIPPKKHQTDDEKLAEFLKKAKLEPNKELMPFYYICPQDDDGCLHKNCPNCHGTGQSVHGTCIHMISCPCKSCTPWMMTDRDLQYNNVSMAP